MNKRNDWETHYQMGEQSAARGDTADDMPKFKNANRAAAWMNGYNAEKQRQKQRADAANACPEGIARLKALAQSILG